MSRMCASQIHIQIDFIKPVKYQPSNLPLNLVKTNGCQLKTKKYLAKTFETLIKTIYMLL